MTEANPKRCDRPCGGCPWRASNQTPEAIEASPIHGGGGRWFDPSNLRRHWKAVSNGSLLPCHATDRNAPLYGGKAPAKGAKPRVCVGVAILARREVTAFMVAGNNFARYRASGGSMSLLGLASWAGRLLFGGAVLHVGREELLLPTVGDDSAVTLPTSRRKAQ